MIRGLFDLAFRVAGAAWWLLFNKPKIFAAFAGAGVAGLALLWLLFGGGLTSLRSAKRVDVGFREAPKEAARLQRERDESQRAYEMARGEVRGGVMGKRDSTRELGQYKMATADQGSFAPLPQAARPPEEPEEPAAPAPPIDPCAAAKDPATGEPLTKAIAALRVRPPLPADGSAFQAGIDAAEAALLVAPECSDAWASLAFASYRRHYDVCGKGDYARASEAVEKAVALATTPSARAAALRNKGRIHAARLEWDAATAAFTAAQVEAPDNKEAKAWLDDLGVRASPRPEVLALVRRVLASEPIAKEELDGFSGPELGFAANAALAKYGRRLNAATVDWFYYCDDSPLAPHATLDPRAASAPVPKGSVDQANQKLLDATARERRGTP